MAIAPPPNPITAPKPATEETRTMESLTKNWMTSLGALNTPDTVPPTPAVLSHSKITVLPVAPLLARAIRSIRQNESLRNLGQPEPR